MKTTSHNPFLLKQVLTVVCITSTSYAADQTWKSAGFTNGNWITTTNWVGGAAPGGASGVASGDTATFNGAANLTVTPDGARNIRNITFDTGTAGAFTIAGGGLVLTNAGAITVNSNVVNTQTINTNLLLSMTASSTYSFINNSSTGAAKLNIGGNVTGQAAATLEVLTLGGTNGGTISGIIGNGAGPTGTVGVTKIGSGAWTLTGATTFTGGLNVNGGTLGLDFASLVTPTNLVASTNTLGLGGGGILNIKAKTGAFTTSQTLGNLSVSAGGGSILLDPNNSDGVNLALGSLGFGGSGSSLLVGTALSAGTGTVAITTTTNKNAQDIYGARVVFANGTADTGYDWATTASGSSPYTLEAYAGYSGLLLDAGTDTTNSLLSHSGVSDITTSLTGSRTTNTLKLENTATGGTQTLALGTFLLNIQGGGLLSTGTRAETISGTAGGTRLTANSGNGYDLVVHQYNSGGLTISAVIGNANGGANLIDFTKAGTGTLTLSGLNTYTGATTVSAGTLRAGAVNTFSSGSATTVHTGATLDVNGFNNTINTLTMAGGAATLGAGTLTATTLNFTNTSTISGGTLNAATINNSNLNGLSAISSNITRSGNLTFNGGGGATSLDLSGTINLGANSFVIGNAITAGTNAITISGSSSNTMALVLQGRNPASFPLHTVTLAKTGGAISVSGNISIGQATHAGQKGIVQLGGNEQIADTAQVSLYSSGYAGNTQFRLLDYDETIAGLNSVATSFVGGTSGNAIVENGSAVAGTSTLTVSGSGTYTFGPVASSTSRLRNGSTGILAFTKDGAGTQIFSSVGDLSYTGATTINNGTLSIRSSTLTNSDTTLAGGTLNLQTATLNKAISGTTGQVTITGETNTNFGGGNKTYSVDTVLSDAATLPAQTTLTQTAANSLSASSLHNIGTGATLRTGNLAGSVKALTGVGSVDLNGTSANLTIADGAGQDFGGAIGGTGKLTKSGAGTQTLSGTNTYTGNTTVNAGTLVLSSSGSLTFKPTTNGTSNKVTGSGSATLNGTLVLDLTSANLTSGNSWTLVDVTTPTYGLVGISSPGLVFMNSSGVWTATSGSDVWTFTQSSGVLSHTVTPGYSSWALGKGLDGTVGHENGALDDPNKNGILNVVEYVLNGDPLNGESPATILPTLDASGSNFVFTFTRRVESAGDTTQIFEHGTNLSGWTPLNITAPTDGAVTLGTPTGGSPNLQTVTVTVAKGANTTMFGRLKASKP